MLIHNRCGITASLNTSRFGGVGHLTNSSYKHLHTLCALLHFLRSFRGCYFLICLPLLPKMLFLTDVAIIRKIMHLIVFVCMHWCLLHKQNLDPLLYAFSCQGVITEDVVQLRKSIGAPGMAVLQFGSKSLFAWFGKIIYYMLKRHLICVSLIIAFVLVVRFWKWCKKPSLAS